MATKAESRRAVFLDRDGVLNEDSGYVYKVEDLALRPGTGEALVALRKRGFLLIVISNQSGVARGYYTMADVERFHAAMQDELQKRFAVQLDAFYVCPDHPDAPSERRKPAPGMVLEATRDFGVDLARSWFVGDRDTDMQCAAAAGVRGILVKGGLAEALAQLV